MHGASCPGATVGLQMGDLPGDNGKKLVRLHLPNLPSCNHHDAAVPSLHVASSPFWSVSCPGSLRHAGGHWFFPHIGCFSFELETRAAAPNARITFTPKFLILDRGSNRAQSPVIIMLDPRLRSMSEHRI